MNPSAPVTSTRNGPWTSDSTGLGSSRVDSFPVLCVADSSSGSGNGPIDMHAPVAVVRIAEDSRFSGSRATGPAWKT